MIWMLQLLVWLQQNCYKFNALVVLLTLILFDRFSIDFAITVKPIETIKSSSNDFMNYNTDELHMGNKQFEITTSSTLVPKEIKIGVADAFSGLTEMVRND